jgi:hypothetical protein
MESYYDDYIDCEDYEAPAWRIPWLGITLAILVAIGSIYGGVKLAAWERQSLSGFGPFAELKLSEKINHAEIGTWQLEGFSPAQADLFARLLDSGDDRANPYLREVAKNVPVVLIAKGKYNRCGYTASCVFTQTNADGSSWNHHTIYLREEHLTATRDGQFILWNEIGHAVDNLGISNNLFDEINQTFNERFKTWPKDQLGITVPNYEVWAEQWAMWATNQDSRSIYKVKLVLSDAEMENILTKYQVNLRPADSIEF